MKKTLEKIKTELQMRGIPVIEVYETEFPDAENHAIRINETVTVSVSSKGPFYMSTTQEFEDDESFIFGDLRTDINDIVNDLSKIIHERN